MERWKIQERAYPMYSYDQEETFDIEEDKNYNLDAVHDHFVNKQTHKNNPHAQAQNNNDANGTYPVQKLNTHRRRKKKKKAKEDTSFYMLNDEDDIASQCLSGMSAVVSPVNRDGLASLLKEEASDNDEEESQLIFTDAEDPESPGQDIVYNEEWGDIVRRREDAKVLPESDASPLRSPSRRKMKKNGKENGTYVVLEENDDGDGDSFFESHGLNDGTDIDSCLQGNDSVTGSCRHCSKKRRCKGTARK